MVTTEALLLAYGISVNSERTQQLSRRNCSHACRAGKMGRLLELEEGKAKTRASRTMSYVRVCGYATTAVLLLLWTKSTSQAFLSQSIFFCKSKQIPRFSLDFNIDVYFISYILKFSGQKSRKKIHSTQAPSKQHARRAQQHRRTNTKQKQQHRSYLERHT